LQLGGLQTDFLIFPGTSRQGRCSHDFSLFCGFFNDFQTISCLKRHYLEKLLYNFMKLLHNLVWLLYNFAKFLYADARLFHNLAKFLYILDLTGFTVTCARTWSSERKGSLETCQVLILPSRQRTVCLDRLDNQSWAGVDA
jgi:hypothetical protein